MAIPLQVVILQGDGNSMGTQVTETMEGSALATIALTPSRIQFNRFICVIKGLLEVAEGGIASGAIGVEDVIRRVKFDCLTSAMSSQYLVVVFAGVGGAYFCVEVDCTGEVLCSKCLGALCLELSEEEYVSRCDGMLLEGKGERVVCLHLFCHRHSL